MSDNETKTLPENQTREDILAHVGKRLHEARESKKLAKERISHDLKLRKSYIDAMEAGDWSDMPEDVYALAFLRQYAKYLNLDIEEQVAQLKSDQYKLTKPLTFPDPAVSPNKSWAVIAAILFIFLFVGFNIFWDSEKKEGLPDSPPLAPVQQTAEPQPDTKSVIPEEAQVQTPQQAPNDDDSITENTDDNETSLPPEDSKASEANDTAETLMPGMHSFSFTTINGDNWIAVYLSAGDKKPVRQRLMKQGETLTVTTSNTSIWIDSGNSSSLQVEADGQVILQAGDIKRNVIKRREFRIH